MTITNLITSCEFAGACDLCGDPIKVGERVLSNIASCCGPHGCVRTICAKCVCDAAKDLGP